VNRQPRRRRSRPSLAARVRTFWLLGAVAAVALASAGWTLATLPAFRLASLTVTGLAHVTRAEVVRRAAIDPHDNVWLLDRAAIERRIEAIPYVDRARVHRRPLANVWIEVVERSPDGCVRASSETPVTVDASARVLETGCAATLPIYRLHAASHAVPGAFLRDPELAALQRDARLLAAAGAHVRELRHDAFDELEVVMPGGLAVRFGDEDDLARKERLIGPILAQLGARAADVRAVDLRAPATPVVEYRR
jgi:cell division protein FtsQ